MEISAKIIAHSKSGVNGKEIITFELEYPRFIHGELMTHRLFSRNAASSRAIPVAKMIEQVRSSPAQPCHWGKNQPGMQAKEELDDWNKGLVQGYWEGASHHAARLAEDMNSAGAHKQIVNRILEPFQWMKTVLTATEFDNFFWLRKHPDAQPEIKMLAEKMWEALQESAADVLRPGDWHVPYVMTDWDDESNFEYWLGEQQLTLEEALMVSSSCCAQVSYRLLDDSLEKAKDIYQKLVESQPVHASPFEHQATPISQSKYLLMDEPGLEDMKIEVNLSDDASTWERGVTHSDRNSALWSGNFKSWVQHRQLIPDNTCWKFEE